MLEHYIEFAGVFLAEKGNFSIGWVGVGFGTMTPRVEAGIKIVHFRILFSISRLLKYAQGYPEKSAFFGNSLFLKNLALR